jgi:hypothetical protein
LLEGALLAFGQGTTVEETEGKLDALGRAEALREAVSGVVLVELSRGDVPPLRVLADGRSHSECSGDAFGGVAADLVDTGAAVVAKAAVDVGELGLHGGPTLFERAGSAETTLEVSDATFGLLDLFSTFADGSGELLDNALGVGDGSFVAAAMEGALVFGEGVERSLEAVAGVVEPRNG